ncbi:MAG: hypothetical protein R3346_03455 [Candidatus Spechtbacterales bacterium]|nr:hypothetical protein [Candidatus Spechtbacterales bacterium]
MMSQPVLEKLFDSSAKLRLLKLFLRNPDDAFTIREIRKRTLLKSDSVRKQIKKLDDIQLVNSAKRKSGEKSYYLNKNFVFLNELQNLILGSSPADQKKMAKKLRSVGRIKLALVSGIFLQPEKKTRTDLLVVADKLDQRKFKTFMKNLQAEAGTEINYSVMTAEEFDYRRKMFDRFILDTLEKPHKKLINKIV